MESLLAKRVIPMDFAETGIAPKDEGPGRKNAV
jgi:hypothetical protein